jgi:hypothetical protein
VLTRTNDSYKTNSDRYTFCNSAGATILVSVHTNSVTDASVDGSMGLYFQTDDKVLAKAIYDIMYPSLRDTAPDPANFTGFGLSRFASGVLLKSDMPAAMMEPLFMSNPSEATLLAQHIYDDAVTGTFSAGCDNFACRRGQIAQVLHQGVLNYFASIDPTPEPSPEPGGTMHVAAIDMWYQQKGPNVVVYTRVVIHDSDEGPVAGALVSATTALPDGATVSETNSTADDGTVTFTVRSRQTGTYASEVTDVGKVSWVYDAEANMETVEALAVP